MKTFILFIALSSLANSAFPSEWFYLMGEASDQTVFFDKESAEREGNTLTMWVRHIALSESKPIAPNVFSLTKKMRYNCSKKTATILRIVGYDKKREVVSQVGQLKEQEIVPDSIGDALFKIACFESFPNSLPTNSALGLPNIDTYDFAAEIAEKRKRRSAP